MNRSIVGRLAKRTVRRFRLRARAEEGSATCNKSLKQSWIEVEGRLQPCLVHQLLVHALQLPVRGVHLGLARGRRHGPMCSQCTPPNRRPGGFACAHNTDFLRQFPQCPSRALLLSIWTARSGRLICTCSRVEERRSPPVMNGAPSSAIGPG